MSEKVLAPWHRASFDEFLYEHLPALLAERLPLAGYQVEESGTYTCSVTVALLGQDGEVSVTYADLPRPDESGFFRPVDEALVALPIAEHERLETATIRCVGEQLFAFVVDHLGQAPPDLPWNEALLRAWLPLDVWLSDFLSAMTHPVENTNWLSRQSHLRSLWIPELGDVIAPGQFGRTCPFETPEGPRVGQVLRIATGAEIRVGVDGRRRLAVLEDGPVAKLGLVAAMIPFLEHDDPNRILMGANMLRQWIPQRIPEPALVQTGYEPDETGVWNGRNLLTAYVSWGPGTFEDGVIVSESCACRFDTPYALRVGDKVANRHGTKGVVSQILPDETMPHLPDGTPVDMVFNFAALHRRMYFGQVREAVMGRVAHVAGASVVVQPFAAPFDGDLRAHLAEAGLPESGMETLTMGKDGPPLERPSTVGWVYWGRLCHLAEDKFHAYMDASGGQRQGEMENYTLSSLGAFENVREALGTRSIRHPDVATLAPRVAAGTVEQAAAPTPVFRDLALRLRAAGIAATLEGEHLAFRFVPEDGHGLRLARPLPHPWLHERMLAEIGVPGTRDQAAIAIPPALIEANERLSRMLAGQAPGKLVADAAAQLESRVRDFFEELLTPVHMRLSEQLLFSGRAVLTPGTDLTVEQVGLPEEAAWTLFAPLLLRELGDEAMVKARDARAAQALDALMARSWVIINRAPTTAPTALLAFHPLRVSGDALHLHPMLCEWLNADFDGDQAAMHLPVTGSAQREAGETLSVAAHLRRDPGLLASLLPRLDALWGLAELSRKPGGLEDIEHLAGAPVAAPRGFVTRSSLYETLRGVLAQEGVEATLARLEHLLARGFEVAQASGASLAPFVETAALLPPQPAPAQDEAWDAYVEEVTELLAAPTDCAPAALDPQCLMVRAAGLGLEQLAYLIGGRGEVKDVTGRTVIVRHGYTEGYTPEEMLACVADARRGLAQVFREWSNLGRTFREQHVSRSLNVLTRALRAQRPGMVFARAAALGEVDPLLDVEARLLVGLPV